MTAREALQALVDGTIPDVKYSPVDRIKAIVLLDEMERRTDDETNGLGSLLEALNGTAADSDPYSDNPTEIEDHIDVM